MIWDAIYMALNSTIGGTLEPLDTMVKRLKNELNTTITSLNNSFTEYKNGNHAGYRTIIEEYEDAGTYRIIVPYGATKVRVTANAGGGGYSDRAGGYYSGGNGASLTNHEYAVPSNLTNFILTVGYAGVYVSYGGTGTDGGDTIVGSFVTLKGGKGGSNGGANGTGGDGATPQNSLHKTNRGYGGASPSYPATDGWCKLEWIF